ncbi:AAA family ATPase [Solirubrobacter ginsenosidimutans]|uniref:AAA family ATPase n=1 Tax=Solirubrobacter ginsenosidimutans TaxID=490573 RepID=A0A9X3MPH7_9ACTN|nr:LuxR family transcriptional regulator [Solirubrobacter ginsenosidimutans]MDA0158868.1 AAA family ATPase [Solirubrobacter ginsenosidimutans]
MAAEHLRGRTSERAELDRVLEAARGGHSAVLVIRGEAGIGKSALLRSLTEDAAGFRVEQTAGVESEMELAYAGLHQLCAPMLDGLDALSEPQQVALRVALGLASGDPPDRFLVALATLGLLAAVAEERPLLCVVDDLQWLDDGSAPVLGFVARRLLAEPVALVFAVREPSGEPLLPGLPELRLRGLDEEEARALLAMAVPGPIDEHVRDRIVAETRGNPLAVLELARGVNAAELAGGFEAAIGASGSVDFRPRLAALPADTRRLLQLAAADPVGDPLLVWRAAERLGLGPQAATPAVDADLLEIGTQVRFRHPLVRSAAYRSAPAAERHALHAALAEATDADAHPDRRAWHRAHAAPGPDEAVAEELERSAARAQIRGGIAASAAFLESAATLTPEPGERVRRLLAAARAKRDAGALEAALSLLGAASAGPTSAVQAAEVEHLRGQIAFDQRRAGDAARLLVGAAERFESLDPALARETHLEAIGAAIWAADPDGIRAAAEAARVCPRASGAVDVVLDALAVRLTEGYGASVPALRQALGTVLAQKGPDGDLGRWLWLTGLRATGLIALELWDIDAWHELASRQVEVAREAGALVQLQFALNFFARCRLACGELADAAVLIEEEHVIAQAMGGSAVGYNEMQLAAWRGEEARATELIERMTRESSARGLGRMVDVAAYTKAGLYNGIGRYDAARDAARAGFAHRDHLGYGMFVVAELAEASSRTGDPALVEAAVDWLSERTPVVRSDWALGIEARVRALLNRDDAERSYQSSIAHLGRTRLRMELARAQLLYGEWLRRNGRRADAREHLRSALDTFDAIGARGFGERARHEVLATGATVRKRRDDTRDDLTPQEEHIARLALAGRSNPEIGAELFISPRTVEWHMKKVFIKLGISSRKELAGALPVPA